MQRNIGNTPLIKIYYQYENKKKYIYTKLESYNLTGSIKDRVAYYIITKAKERGELKEGMPIIEATSGNTGISLAAMGAAYHHPVYIFMPNWVSEERLKLMKMFNAKVILYSKEEGGFIRCIQEAKKLAQDLNGFLANQFENQDNVLAHYETTGKEIMDTIPENIDGFISGVGTGGTLMGIAKKLKEKKQKVVIAALEPDKMPMLSQNKIIGQHLIEGIGDDFIPKIVEKDKIDEIILINDYDAVNMAKIIAKKLGIGVGISSGANLLGAIILQEKIHGNIVTVFPDDNKKYLSTILSEEIDNKETFLSNQIKLLNYEVI